MLGRLIGIGLGICLGLAGCAPGPEFQVRPTIFAVSEMPEPRRFGPANPLPPQRSNADMAEDFLDLFFALETGTRLTQFTRFDGPVTVAVQGRGPDTLMPDLADLLARLRREAGIDIRRGSPQRADILINVISRTDIAQELPGLACIALPRKMDWAGYLRDRRNPQVTWSTLTRRDTAAIFVPGDASPQELRDCLHEELAQVLGPLNDLHRLPDSVFNDDNVHAVLTGFDMLMLRLAYSPALRNGMSRDEVAARLPALLRQMNPRGEDIPNANRTLRSDWDMAWHRALFAPAPWQSRVLGQDGLAQRRVAARRAARIAAETGWSDHRPGWSEYHLSLFLAHRPQEAIDRLQRAYRLLSASPVTALHRARVGERLAGYAVLLNDPQTALALIDSNIEVLRRAQVADALADMMLLRAEALEELGQAAEAQALRLDSLGWARYGFGSIEAVQGKASEVATLNPLRVE